MKTPLPSVLLLLVLAILPGMATAANILVNNQAEYADAVRQVSPGDTIVLANGEWRDFEIVFTGNGTADAPISLTAETPGGVFITGISNLRLAGEHLVVSNLVFRDGYTPTNEVISFRRSKTRLANNSRVTNVVIDHFNNPERYETDFWVMMYGRHNRFDHNYLAGKSNSGVTMAVRLDTEGSQQNHHRIDHNYFGHRPILGSNGGETLRIGTSKYSLTDSHTLVENNYFDRCDGELEIVSIKAGKNVFRGNVFYESRGTLTLRHGNDNLLEDNVFFGNRKDHTGGIRVINKRQTVRNNYMTGLTGYRFGGALVVMNGVPDSPINRYHQVEDSLIAHNSIIDSDHVEFAAGSDAERSAVPITTSFRNNLIVNTEPRKTIAVHDDVSGISFADNVIEGVKEIPVKRGFKKRKTRLREADNGLLYPAKLRGVGIARGLEVLTRDDTGPAWYPKPDSTNEFDSGNVHRIDPGQDTLTEAVEQAGPGDMIELAPGDYEVTKILVLDFPLTVRGASDSRPTISFERSTLFELADGGSLKLESLVIDGANAPDGYGNSVIRTSRYSMLRNYRVSVANSEIRNLNTNHSFNFLKVSGHTFAHTIDIDHSVMRDISGHVIALDREIDDLGIYNGEYISITDSVFENIGGTVANLYRGGTDESTFGPHFVLDRNKLRNVGNNKKRNKTDASVFLLGVQVATLRNNRFSDSRPVRVIRTVADPITTIEQNQLENTEPALVTDQAR